MYRRIGVRQSLLINVDGKRRTLVVEFTRSTEFSAPQVIPASSETSGGLLPGLFSCTRTSDSGIYRQGQAALSPFGDEQLHGGHLSYLGSPLRRRLLPLRRRQYAKYKSGGGFGLKMTRCGIHEEEGEEFGHLKLRVKSTLQKMATLQGPVVCPTIRSRQGGACTVMSNEVVGKAAVLRSQFRGFNGIRGWKANELGATRLLRGKRRLITNCTFSSSSNDNGSKAENFSESDEDYVNSSVIEAVEVKSGSDGFTIKMRDGMFLTCVNNNPQSGHLPDYAPHPAIVLKMEDGTGLLLPIIVLETPSVLLMAAIRNMHIARPTIYNVIKEMVEKMGYVVKLVRVTQRVQEAYYAKIYLSKVNNPEECITFDLRPSDAINIAVRCQVPIQVSKHLANSDGMRVVEEAHKLLAYNPAPNAFSFTEMDRPSGMTIMETEEFNLLRNMMEAASEERYQDAAKWRNELSRLRAKRNWA